MPKTLREEYLTSIFLAPGDSIQFTVTDDDSGDKLFVHTHTAEDTQVINHATVLEFTREFGYKHGYGLLAGERE
jgi:hypothetical protein